MRKHLIASLRRKSITAKQGAANSPSTVKKKYLSSSTCYPQRILDQLSDTLLTSLRTPVVEDSQQMPSALRYRHRLPTLPRLRRPLKCHLQYGRQHLLALHRQHQAFSHLLRAPLPRLRTLHAIDPSGDLPPLGLAQPRNPPPGQHLFALQHLLQLWRHYGLALLQVGSDREIHHRPHASTGSLLHLLIHQHKMPTSPCIGK